MLHWSKGVMANFRINTQHFCMLHTSCSKECIRFNFDVFERGVLGKISNQVHDTLGGAIKIWLMVKF